MSSCVNQLLPALPFAVGADTTPMTMATSNPIIPVAGEPAAKINSEVIINFGDAVDFPSLVGAGNLSTLDPFITDGAARSSRARLQRKRPTCIPIPAFSDIGTAAWSLYSAADRSDRRTSQQTLPLNLGFVVYMPDPFNNPTQVRIRFVDNSSLIGQGVNQNYASNPTRLPITGAGGGVLPLPAGAAGSRLGAGLHRPDRFSWPRT